MTVTELHIYPVKSCRGIALQGAEVGRLGFLHDRQWMFVDGRGMFLAQRGERGQGVEARSLCFVRTAVLDGTLRITAPDMPPLDVPLQGRDGPGADVQVWDAATVGIVFIKDCRLIDCNPQFERMFGYAPGELRGASSRLWFPDDDSWNATVSAAHSHARAGNPYPPDDVRYTPTIDEEVTRVKALDVEAVKAFHAKFYGASHAELAIVGDFDVAAVRRLARDLFGDFTGKTAYARVPQPFYATASAPQTFETPDKANAAMFGRLAMPLNDQAVSAFLMQAAMGQVASPNKVMAAVIRIAGSASEQAVQRAGFAPLVDAMLSHAQAQIPALQQYGAFADIDLVCRSVDRFHRLMRAITGFIELGRLTRWSR